MLSVVIERMQFSRMKKQPARFVSDEGVVVPAVPEAGHNLRKLSCTFVSFSVLKVSIASKILRFLLLPGGNLPSSQHDPR